MTLHPTPKRLAAAHETCQSLPDCPARGPEPPSNITLFPELLRQLPPLFQDLKPVSTTPEPLETARQRFVPAPGLETPGLLLRPFYKPALPPLAPRSPQVPSGGNRVDPV